jgi:transposase
MLERDGHFLQEGGTDVRNVIGIDPDAKEFVCSLVKLEEPNVIRRRFTATWKDVQNFIRWVKTVENVIVAIEGSNGQSRPIEKGLREAGVVFYSFKPADTDRFRKAVLGQNKNNDKDAESVARYAMALEMQGKLVMRTHRNITPFSRGRQDASSSPRSVPQAVYRLWTADCISA